MESSTQQETSVEGENPEVIAPAGIGDGDFSLEDDEEKEHGEGEEELSEDAEALKEELDKIIVVPPEPEIPLV